VHAVREHAREHGVDLRQGVVNPACVPAGLLPGVAASMAVVLLSVSRATPLNEVPPRSIAGRRAMLRAGSVDRLDDHPQQQPDHRGGHGHHAEQHQPVPDTETAHPRLPVPHMRRMRQC